MQEIIAFGLTKAELLVIFIGFIMLVVGTSFIVNLFQRQKPSVSDMLIELQKANDEFTGRR
ncbi:hypothetical protein [Acinetobacter phage ABPH49]|nr:hypothetical protein [Acinetobacter phage ABPH49]